MNGLQAVHILMGAANCQRIKTTELSISGKNPDKYLEAETTMLGWTLTGKTVTSHTKSECSLSTQDQISLKECATSTYLDSHTDYADELKYFHEGLKEQLQKNEEGYYTTHFPLEK